eukprot:TRINITY_DN88599_c0_g1_i1.p1 TRINITY_DN88599_c0_g1~~TRINITY_DN88599_c0_g1_i1.p1  ORF type:complete len:549 (+),score=56.24 TRINITY_DN88599_c0_g1_i1:154-1800(+)
MVASSSTHPTARRPRGWKGRKSLNASSKAAPAEGSFSQFVYIRRIFKFAAPFLMGVGAVIVKEYLEQPGKAVLREMPSRILRWVCTPYPPEHREVSPIKEAANELQSTLYSVWAKCFLQGDFADFVEKTGEIAYLIAVFLAHDQRWRENSWGRQWPGAEKKLLKVRNDFGWTPNGEMQSMTFYMRKVMRLSVGNEMLHCLNSSHCKGHMLGVSLEDFIRSIRQGAGVLHTLYSSVNASCLRLERSRGDDEGFRQHGMRLALLQNSLVDFLETLEGETAQLRGHKTPSFPRGRVDIENHSTECNSQVQVSHVRLRPAPIKARNPSIRTFQKLLCFNYLPSPRQLDPLKEAAYDLQSLLYHIGEQDYISNMLANTEKLREWRNRGLEAERSQAAKLSEISSELAYLIAVFLAHDQAWKDQSLSTDWPDVDNCLRNIRGSFGWAATEDQTLSVRKVMRFAIGQKMLLDGSAASLDGPPVIMPYVEFTSRTSSDVILSRFYGKVNASCTRLYVCRFSCPSAYERLKLIQTHLLNLLCLLDGELCNLSGIRQV